MKKYIFFACLMAAFTFAFANDDGGGNNGGSGSGTGNGGGTNNGTNTGNGGGTGNSSTGQQDNGIYIGTDPIPSNKIPIRRSPARRSVSIDYCDGCLEISTNYNVQEVLVTITDSETGVGMQFDADLSEGGATLNVALSAGDYVIAIEGEGINYSTMYTVD